MSDRKKLFLIVGVMTVLRATAAASVPLLGGEAYYWLWGRYPAAGYFDHPPMAGVMSLLFFSWVDGSKLAARSAPILLGAVTTFLIYELARRLFPSSKTAFRAAALFSVVPIFDALCVAIEPDNSLMLFMALTWILFWGALQKRTSLAAWSLTGVAAGLALLSKFHAWALLPPLYGTMLFSRTDRKLLLTPGPWLAIVIAIAVLSPNLVWNAKHEWINYAYQWHRSGISKREFEIGHLLQYYLGPLMTLSPFVYVAMIVGSVKAIRVWFATQESAILFLLCAGLPLVIFLGALAPTVSIALHWPAAAYIPLVILALELMGRGQLFGRGFSRAMWSTSIGMTAFAHLAPVFVASLPNDFALPVRRDDLNAARLKSSFVGWDEIGAKAREIHDEMNKTAPALIMTPGEHLTAQLAFYSQRPRSCFAVEADEAHNFTIWAKERGGLAGNNAVVIISNGKLNRQFPSVEEKYKTNVKFLKDYFDRVEIAPSLVCYQDGEVGEELGVDISRPRIREFFIFRCYGFKGEPPKSAKRSRAPGE